MTDPQQDLAPLVATDFTPEQDVWHKLNHRVIWADVGQTILALSPLLFALFVLGQRGNLWPLVAVAAFGAIGAIGDAVRWAVTSYRITPQLVEIKTGLFVRQHRAVQRDRIRSVDIEAKLRHRVTGLRVVKIGAAQALGATGSTISLDAVLAAEARALHGLLLRSTTPPANAQPSPQAHQADSQNPLALQTSATISADNLQEALMSGEVPPVTDVESSKQVYATFSAKWIPYNMVVWWGLLFTTGIAWGGYWLLSTFGLPLEDIAAAAVGWDSLPRSVSVTLIVLISIAAVLITNGLRFLSDVWRLELARVAGDEGTSLRTRKGLLTTREVMRADKRLRGIYLVEPLAWRWLKLASLEVITTGLSIWSSSQPSIILPRVKKEQALGVARQVLPTGTPHALDLPLDAHPRRALRRRIVWAIWVSLLLGGLTIWTAMQLDWPQAIYWTAVIFPLLALPAAFVAYRSLGHKVQEDFVIARSGLINRSTAVLLRSSVSTVAIRESIFQRRLGLRTVSLMTAAGLSVYEVPDIGRDHAATLANEASLGLLEPFLQIEQD